MPTPWVESPSVTVDHDLPPDERYHNLQEDVLNSGRMLFEALAHEFPSGAGIIAGAVNLRTKGRFREEAMALAQAIGANWHEVLLVNLAYDFALRDWGCSTIALATPDGPVLARNMDWSPEAVLAKASYLIHHDSSDGLRLAIAGWPGSIGVVSGMSGRGFAVVLNAVIAPGGMDRLGYPVLLHIRRVLEDADGFDHAVEWLARQRLTSGALLTVVGSSNVERVCIERTPTDNRIRRPRAGEPLATTNHYRLLPNVCYGETVSPDGMACARLAGLQTAFDDCRGDIEVEDKRLLFTLSDDKIMQMITAQHMIIRPARSTMRLFVPRHLLAPEKSPGNDL
ncbi:MAG: C45 family autoproteolytic acyltransferase/hydrolase [Planctomycetota bacterium]|jgi:hypothetical protein